MSTISALQLVHDVLAHALPKGGTAIDATAGRGYDAAFLCRIVGEEGRVLAFDIQSEAISSTKALLAKEGLCATVIQDSHANMACYAEQESVDCIVFNLGYLPKGDHSIYTRFSSTQAAITAGLSLLKKGGLMCISIYYGGDSGYEEKEALVPFLQGLDDSRYQVLTVEFSNWTKDPPIPVFIRKL